ncbi:MAG: type pilus assembly protein PilM [Solirubrobacteraceae bacterium]|nr:type pilus assembly protein PilM [Solirubrobacteraceae bacterium]
MPNRLNQPIKFKRPSMPARKHPVEAPASQVKPAEQSASKGRLSQPIKLRRPSASIPSMGSLRRGGEHRRPAQALVGLDIEPSGIVAVQVHLDGGKASVERAAGIPLPPDVFRDGEVSDVATLTASLAELFRTSGLSRRVRIGVANQRIVVRRLELPPIADPKELATAVRFQAQDEIPMPLDSVIMDFHSLGVAETPNGPRQQIVLVAARRDMVERVFEAARAAGLRPEGIDLSAFAMIRALAPPAGPVAERVLYLAIGGLTNLAVAEGQTCQFTRVIGGGIDQIVADVAERCQVALPQARQLVADSHPDVARRPVDGGEEAQPAAGGHQEVARAAVVEGIHRIAAEVRNSLDFHHGQDQGAGTGVARAVLCGAALDVAGFDRVLSAELGMPVEAGLVSQMSADAAGGVPASRLTVAAGLAIEEGAS